MLLDEENAAYNAARAATCQTKAVSGENLRGSSPSRSVRFRERCMQQQYTCSKATCSKTQGHQLSNRLFPRIKNFENLDVNVFRQVADLELQVLARDGRMLSSGQ